MKAVDPKARRAACSADGWTSYLKDTPNTDVEFPPINECSYHRIVGDRLFAAYRRIMDDPDLRTDRPAVGPTAGASRRHGVATMPRHVPGAAACAQQFMDDVRTALKRSAVHCDADRWARAELCTLLRSTMKQDLVGPLTGRGQGLARGGDCGIQRRRSTDDPGHAVDEEL